MTTHTHHSHRGAWDDDQDRDPHDDAHDQDQRGRGRHQHHKRTRPAFRHHRVRPRAADGECGLRLPGVDGHCSGTERVSVGNGRTRNRRGCTEHAAQTLVRLPSWSIAGGSPRARAELEAHMRAVGSWRPEMGGRG